MFGFKNTNNFAEKSFKLEIIMIFLVKRNNAVIIKEETRECVCLRERDHNISFDSCINTDVNNSFFVYNSKLVQFEEDYRSMVTY